MRRTAAIALMALPLAVACGPTQTSGERLASLPTAAAFDVHFVPIPPRPISATWDTGQPALTPLPTRAALDFYQGIIETILSVPAAAAQAQAVAHDSTQTIWVMKDASSGRTTRLTLTVTATDGVRRDWQVQVQRRDGTWSSVAAGACFASGHALKCTEGAARLDLETLRSVGIETPALNGYSAASLTFQFGPGSGRSAVSLEVALAPDAIAPVTLAHDAAGGLNSFDGRGDFGLRSTGFALISRVRAQWDDSKEGRVDLSGEADAAAAPAHLTECWDREGLLLFGKRSSDGVSFGDEGKCLPPTGT